jgi:hypothetical protein
MGEKGQEDRIAQTIVEARREWESQYVEGDTLST